MAFTAIESRSNSPESGAAAAVAADVEAPRVILWTGMGLPYPPSRTLTIRPLQHKSATSCILSVTHEKSSGSKSRPVLLPCFVLPTSPLAASKPVLRRMRSGLKARSDGRRREVMACRNAPRPDVGAVCAFEPPLRVDGCVSSFHNGRSGTLMTLCAVSSPEPVPGKNSNPAPEGSVS